MISSQLELEGWPGWLARARPSESVDGAVAQVAVSIDPKHALAGPRYREHANRLHVARNRHQAAGRGGVS